MRRDHGEFFFMRAASMSRSTIEVHLRLYLKNRQEIIKTVRSQTDIRTIYLFN